MEPDNNVLSFGRYLKTVRQESGIELDLISNETRIGVSILLLLEKEEHTGLPAEVFVKGFIRSYAKAIGADAEKAISLYHDSLEQHQKSINSEADLIRNSSRFWPRLIVFLVILVILMGLSVFVMEKGLNSLGYIIGQTHAKILPVAVVSVGGHRML